MLGVLAWFERLRFCRLICPLNLHGPTPPFRRMSSLRRSLQRFAEDLQLFSSQLSQETQELRRNVEHKPITGATNFRHCLEDISDRLTAVGEETQALESLSLDAISLEELVGHCAALYAQNHAAIAQLEQWLQQYGYRDLYSPLPPENPLDMMLLHSVPAQHQHAPAPARAASPGAAHTQEAGGLREPLEPLTNQLAAASLHDNIPGSALRPPPRTAVKAMAPMTAAKARARSDTPSSLSSPFEAMSPSMRDLLGKYAASSCGVPTQYSGTPFSQASPPMMGQLSPAFEAARLASEQAQGAAELTPEPGDGLHAHTPEAAGNAAGWQQDPAMYNALTATAKKLANKPDFLEQYRQRFPHIVASTERLLASVEKQPPGQGRGPQHAAVHSAAGPMTALAAAAAAGAAATQAQQQHAHVGGLLAGPSRLGTTGACLKGGTHQELEEEETTLQLYSQVISSRPYPAPQEGAVSAEEHEPAAATLTPVRATATSLEQTSTPSTEQLLNRAFNSGAYRADPTSDAVLRSHPIMSLGSSGGAVAQGTSGPANPSSATMATSLARATAAQLAAGTAGAAGSSALRPDRSRPDLQEAIEAALGRGHSQALQPASAAAPAAAAAAITSTACTAPQAPGIPGVRAGAGASGVPSMQSVPGAAASAQPRQAAAQPSVVAAAAPQEVPPLRSITQQEYESLPTFIRGQLPLEQVNSTLATVHAAVMERAAGGGVAGFTLDDLEGLGMGPKAKVFINSIVKLSRAHLKVVYGQGTIYLLL